ncbi:MAG TPA: hypothetical protein VHG93_17935 [Longimicrobium sp.]|nr:hypothetical protein [Longimicrobium sp.]
MVEATGPGGGKDGGKKGVSKTALALGAAGLFLFIVGVKRKYRLDAERDIAAERQRSARESRDEADG